MTLVMNRSDRKHRRRLGALERMRGRLNDTPEQRRAVDEETVVLLVRTKATPTINFTRKRLADPGCSEARKAWRRGKMG